VADASLVRCTACGAKNRVPTQKVALGLAPRCGRCHAPLSLADGGPIVVTDATFAEVVERSALPVLLDAWAAWCAPCRMIAPVVEELASELAGRVRVGKLDVDANPHTAARFGIRSIPTLLVMSGGREVDRIVGVVPKDEIARRLAAVVGS
jgi:thioredoxin 2